MNAIAALPLPAPASGPDMGAALTLLIVGLVIMVVGLACVFGGLKWVGGFTMALGVTFGMYASVEIAAVESPSVDVQSAVQHVYGISLTQDNAAALRYPSAPPEEGAPKTYGAFETINDGEWVRIILAWDGEELSLAYADATGLPGDELERATREEPRPTPTPTPTPRHTSLEDILVTP